MVVGIQPGGHRTKVGRVESRIHDSNMAAATSVVVLDRGNNTTCTINLHGAFFASTYIKKEKKREREKGLKIYIYVYIIKFGDK